MNQPLVNEHMERVGREAGAICKGKVPMPREEYLGSVQGLMAAVVTLVVAQSGVPARKGLFTELRNAALDAIYERIDLERRRN